MNEANHRRKGSRHLRHGYRQLFETVSEILFRHDPMHLSSDDNPGEYDPEAGTILPRLQTCTSAAEARRLIHREFSRWFDTDSVGLEETYEPIAQEVWTAWEKFQQEHPPMV